MSKLYPLKFTPIVKDKIWGGNKLKEFLKKPTATDKSGESWEISGVGGDVSVVENGFLAGNNLSELIEVYMSDLLGDKVFSKFGNEFPLLIKFIHAADNLSIQVHPDDEVAGQRHHSFGKTEMWYIMEAEKDANLIIGFNQKLTKEDYFESLEAGKLESIMNYESISAGDVFFIPAGRVHAIGAGTLLAEIQQTSDVTYRIYDYNRKDDNGNFRELHTELALDVIDFEYHDHYKSQYTPKPDQVVPVVECPYFHTGVLILNKPVKRDFMLMESFVIYICTEGKVEIKGDGYSETIEKGQTVLIPAVISSFELAPTPPSKLLEVYIP